MAPHRGLGPLPPQELGSQIGLDPVHQPRLHQPPVELGASLGQDAVHPHLPQQGDQGGQVHAAVGPLGQGENLDPQVPVGGQPPLLGDAGGQAGGDLPGGLYHLGGERGAQVGVTDQAQGVPPPLHPAGELGVVGQHRAHPHQNGPVAAALGVDVAAGGLPGDPLGGPGVGRQLAIQGHGVLEHHIGPAGLDVVKEHVVQGPAFLRQHPHGHLDPLGPKLGQALAAQWGGQAYPTWEALLADPAIDAVSICAANTAHAELTIAALRAGKHVLCEKPMATTLADCEAMAAAARESGRFLMIGQNQRLTKAHQKARQLVADGVLGDILTFRTTFGHGGPETWSVDPGKNTWFFDKSKAAMGAMADLGIHKTDLIQYLLGQTVVEATAKVTTLDKRGADGQLIGVDDNAICIYRMSGGAIGTMTASWTYYGAEDNSTVLYGTKGILRIYDDPAYSLKLITAGGEKALYELEAIQTNDNQTASGVIDCFMDCLTGNTPPAISGESVLTAMRAVFACLESSRTGRAVSVAQD